MDFCQGFLDRIEDTHNCISKAAACRCSTKVGGLLKSFAKFTEKHLCWRFFVIKLQGLNDVIFVAKETSAHVFTCEFCGIFQKTYL